MDKKDALCLVLISMLCFVPAFVSAQISFETPLEGTTGTGTIIDYNAQQRETAILNKIDEINNKVESSCENAIVNYRSEATKEIEKQKELLITEMNNYIRTQKIIILTAIVLAGFIGCSLALLFFAGFNNSREKEILKCIDQLKEIVELHHKNNLEIIKKKEKKLKEEVPSEEKKEAI